MHPMRTTRLFSLFALLFTLFGSAPAEAQNEARGALYTRVEDGLVRAAIQIRITPSWYLYHTDLGEDPNAVGKPLSIELGGEGITWSEVEPQAEPKTKLDLELGFEVLIHKGKVVFHAAGKLAEGATADDVTATLEGLTCTDAGLCIPYEEELESKGEGSDKYFEDFAAALPASVASHAGEGADDSPAELPQLDGNPVHGMGAEAYARADEDGNVTLVVLVSMLGEYHLYHGPEAEDLGPNSPTGVPTVLGLPEDVEWEQVVYPHPHVVTGVSSETFEDTPTNVHEGNFVLVVRGEGDELAVDGAEVKLTGMACDDSGCLPRFDLDLEVELDGGDDAVWDAALAQLAVGNVVAPVQGDEAAGASGETPATTSQGGADDEEIISVGTEDLGDMSLGSFLLLAMFWGVITLLMPCTYPMIPITISFFTKQAIAREGKVLPLALTYGAGIVLIFILIGVVLGPPIIEFAVHPVTNIIIGGLFFFFAFVLFGAITLQPPAFLMTLAGKASSKGGVAGVFLMGTTLVVTSFTCTAPFVGSLLAVGATGAEGSLLRIVLGMGVFGLTMATPFVFLSLVPGKLQQMPTAGEWMHVLKVFLGFVELAAALKFFSNSDLVWEWGLLSREIFLVLWFGIFLCAAFFLFNWIKLQGEDTERIGAVRMMGGVVTLLFSLYCGMGVIGYQMDDLMTAIIPPYSSERTAGWGSGGGGGAHGAQVGDEHEIVIDDYEGAVTLAASQGRYLLVNFTGHT